MNIILKMYIATIHSKKSQTALLCYLHTKERRADAKREAKPVFQPEDSLLIGMIKFFEKLNLNLFSIMSCNVLSCSLQEHQNRFLPGEPFS